MSWSRIRLLILAAVLCAFGALYYRLAIWPLGSVSEFETVNDAFWLDQVEFTLDKAVYPADTKEIMLMVTNNSEDQTLHLSSHDYHCNWYLEKENDGVWRTQRTVSRRDADPRWHLSPQNGDLNSLGPSGIIQWGGEEVTFAFNIEWYYGGPLETGTYRIVIPACEMSISSFDRYDLAVEFEVK